jgi:hypothetical protein
VPQRRSTLVVTGMLLVGIFGGGSVALAATATQPPSITFPRPPAPAVPSPSASSSAAGTGSAGTTQPPAPVRQFSQGTTNGYNLDFTLPTIGKAGCMVCHGDRNLIRINGDQYVSYYVDDAVMGASAHGPGPKTGPSGLLCTGCHLDFAYKAPHKNTATWRETAKEACSSPGCHKAESDDYGLGVHAIKNRPGAPDPNATKKPLCGDCHGAHDIKRLTSDPVAKAAFRQDGYQVCGRCHQQQWDSYTDYYHGAAYRRGAPDAPACWDCHGTHDILPSSNLQSPTNAANLVATCGKCHDGANRAFVSYTGLVHRRVQALDANPLYAWMMRMEKGIGAALSNIIDTVRSWFS